MLSKSKYKPGSSEDELQKQARKSQRRVSDKKLIQNELDQFEYEEAMTCQHDYWVDDCPYGCNEPEENMGEP